MRRLAAISLALFVGACQSATQTKDALDIAPPQQESSAISNETVGDAATTVAFVFPTNGSRAITDIRNGAVLAHEQLADGKLSLAFLSAGRPEWPVGRDIKIAAIVPGGSVAPPTGAVSIALSQSAPASGFAFLASDADSLEAGLRAAAAQGGRVVIFAEAGAMEAVAEQMKSRLGGPIDVIAYSPQEGATRVVAKATASGLFVAAGFMGKGREIVGIVNAVKKAEPQTAIVGHQGWGASLLANSALNGAIVARADTANHSLIAERYREKYGALPSEQALYGFDIVAIAAGIARTRGPQALNREALLTPSGFRGATGAFQFRNDGTVRRLFEITTVSDGRLQKTTDAPAGF